MSSPMLISIEGNIGCGKSTFLSKLREKTAAERDPSDNVSYGSIDGIKYAFVPEPIDEWNTIRDETGKTMLEVFYEDQLRNAFSFQMMAYISRLVSLKKALKSKVDVVIVERCLYTDRNVFLKMFYDDKKIREVDYQIYHKWFHEFADEVTPNKIVYLQTSPEVCHTRVSRRARDGEDVISVDYLKKCHDYHEEWLSKNELKSDIAILNADPSKTQEGCEDYTDWISTITKLASS